MIQAALLDVDGTLIDSNNAHAQAWVEALEAHDLPTTFAEVRPLIGMGGDRLLPIISGIEEDSARGKQITETRKLIFRDKYLPNLKPFGEVRALLQQMREAGVKLVVATSSGKDMLKELLQKAGIEDLVEDSATKDDAEASKPAPDIVEAALALANVPASAAIMIGDTPYDIQAATRAGVRSIGFECGGWSMTDLGGATAVYRDAADLLKNFASSPFSN